MIKALRSLSAAFALAIALFSPLAQAWSDHASLLWPLVRTMPEMLEPTLRAETLDEFLSAESQGLAVLLAEHEAFARESLENYAPRPDDLAFAGDEADLRDAFLRAIRVNPTLPYALHRQTTVEDAALSPERIRRFQDFSFLDGGSASLAVVYELMESGDAVAAAHVIASGSDEPDFGLDIGLFEDNGTEFGATYGFGTQPFGNPNLDYSSQAPFHMGFYHLDWLTSTAQPDLLRTFPEWRVSLFQTLGAYAFSTGHDYWGWRFMGWALHYIGDLTQPYHAQPLPGVSTAEALWKLVQGETAAAIQLVSNRHGVLESYQYRRVQGALDAQDWDDPILVAIAAGKPTPTFSKTTVRNELTLESVEAGEDLDTALESAMPALFVSDPSFEWTGSGEEPFVVDRVKADGGDAAIEAMDKAVAEQMLRFSRYARAWIELGLKAGSLGATP